MYGCYKIFSRDQLHHCRVRCQQFEDYLSPSSGEVWGMTKFSDRCVRFVFVLLFVEMYNFKNCFVCREFEVESLNFTGQVHKWQLSQLLQKGTERSQESLLNDLALALRFIIVTAKGRLSSHFFSLYEALRALLTGLLRLLGKFLYTYIHIEEVKQGWL